MSACTPFIQTIYPTECLSDSLVKINTNFANLQTKICNIKEIFDSRIEIRTFWYYGPNADSVAGSGMQTGIVSRPSNETIKNFINSRTQLDLPSISNVNDIAYVIFQKTGFYNNQNVGFYDYNNLTRTETTTTFRLERSQGFFFRIVPVTNTVQIVGEHYGNLVNYFAPTFFIWQLTYNGTVYTISPEWPKIVRGQGQINTFAAQPQNWSQYNTI